MAIRKSSAERRQEIADAAIKVIGERGLREFTAANVAREVGIKDGSIFSHFNDMAEVAGAMLDRVQALLEPIDLSIADPVDRLRTFVLGRLHAVSLRPGIQSLLFSDQISHALGDQGPARVAALRNRGRAVIRACLEEGVRVGRIKPDLDVEATILLITGLAMGFLYAAKDEALPAAGQGIEARAWQLVRALLDVRQAVQ